MFATLRLFGRGKTSRAGCRAALQVEPLEDRQLLSASAALSPRQQGAVSAALGQVQRAMDLLNQHHPAGAQNALASALINAEVVLAGLPQMNAGQATLAQQDLNQIFQGVSNALGLTAPQAPPDSGDAAIFLQTQMGVAFLLQQEQQELGLAAHQVPAAQAQSVLDALQSAQAALTMAQFNMVVGADQALTQALTQAQSLLSSLDGLSSNADATQQVTDALNQIFQTAGATLSVAQQDLWWQDPTQVASLFLQEQGVSFLLQQEEEMLVLTLQHVPIGVRQTLLGAFQQAQAAVILTQANVPQLAQAALKASLQYAEQVMATLPHLPAGQGQAVKDSLARLFILEDQAFWMTDLAAPTDPQQLAAFTPLEQLLEQHLQSDEAKLGD